MKKVVIGIIGSGFAAELHACAYQKVCGVEVVLKAVSSLDPKAGEFAKRYGIAAVYEDYHEMLKDPEIDMVDIIAPPASMGPWLWMWSGVKSMLSAKSP